MSKEDQTSRRATFQGLLDRTRRPEKVAEYEAALACPPMPSALAYLWLAYHRLRGRKAGSGFGPSPIEWPDIHAFLLRSRLDLRPWEIEVIEELDDLYLAAQSPKGDSGDFSEDDADED